MAKPPPAARGRQAVEGGSWWTASARGGETALSPGARARPRHARRRRGLTGEPWVPPWELSDVYFDDVRRAGHVDRRAGGDDDAVAHVEEARVASGVDRGVPEVFDVLALLDQERRDSPLERHLPHRPVDGRQRDDRPLRRE